MSWQNLLIDIKYARALDEKDSYDGLFVKVEDPAFAASVRDEIERDLD
ncbi:MAG: hypothetical protein WA977_05640 [Halobacteriota archaeon]